MTLKTLKFIQTITPKKTMINRIRKLNIIPELIKFINSNIDNKFPVISPVIQQKVRNDQYFFNLLAKEQIIDENNKSINKSQNKYSTSFIKPEIIILN